MAKDTLFFKAMSTSPRRSCQGSAGTCRQLRSSLSDGREKGSLWLKLHLCQTSTAQARSYQASATMSVKKPSRFDVNSDRSSPLESSRKFSFFLLHGRNPHLLTEVLLAPSPLYTDTNVTDYKSELKERLSKAWELAHKNIQKAQLHQKVNSDRQNLEQVGERVFLHTPSLRSGTAYKFSQRFRGPYQIIEFYTNDAMLTKVG